MKQEYLYNTNLDILKVSHLSLIIITERLTISYLFLSPPLWPQLRGFLYWTLYTPQTQVTTSMMSSQPDETESEDYIITLV